VGVAGVVPGRAAGRCRGVGLARGGGCRGAQRPWRRGLSARHSAGDLAAGNHERLRQPRAVQRERMPRGRVELRRAAALPLEQAARVAVPSCGLGDACRVTSRLCW